jgi:ribosome-binding protein aMBF1 (putative translation factor)
MEMQVDTQLIRSEREQRAWSQSHLADVSDLGLRTIQRIEATGHASYESASAIAAAFSLSVV